MKTVQQLFAATLVLLLTRGFGGQVATFIFSTAWTKAEGSPWPTMT